MPNPPVGQPIKIILPTLIIACIDSERGQVPRSAWIRCIICQHYPMPDVSEPTDEHPHQSWEIT